MPVNRFAETPVEASHADPPASYTPPVEVYAAAGRRVCAARSRPMRRRRLTLAPAEPLPGDPAPRRSRWSRASRSTARRSG